MQMLRPIADKQTEISRA